MPALLAGRQAGSTRRRSPRVLFAKVAVSVKFSHAMTTRVSAYPLGTLCPKAWYTPCVCATRSLTRSPRGYLGSGAKRPSPGACKVARDHSNKGLCQRCLCDAVFFPRFRVLRHSVSGGHVARGFKEKNALAAFLNNQ